ncbi:MAG: ATP synthase F1 subunit gamma [Proteobacteria bacterium]|nr:ATP synthase F1 subunit gamma [Pseudomonadota bacterium]
MPSLKDIKRRITTVEKTQQITSAMRMVAAAKLRRAEEAIAAARPYAVRMRETLEEVSGATSDAQHPLMEPREAVRTAEVVIITSDRGLAGAFNSNSLKHARRVVTDLEADGLQVEVSTIGRKAAEFATRRGFKSVDAREAGNNVGYGQAADVARRLMQRYEAGEVDRVVLVYSEFVSTLTQTPRDVPLLPVAPAEKSDEDAALPYEIEPSAEALLATLVPKAVEVEVFRALLENQAGEHAARMAAMESATRNTEELIERLTLQFNRARQAAITKELVEIVSGAQALE